MALLLSSTVVVARNNGDKRTAAAALIRKALVVSDFRAPGSPAFELRGTLTVPLRKGKDAVGTYVLDWASPDRWREEIHVADYSRIRVGGVGIYWQLRSTSYELVPFFDFSAAFDFAKDLRFALDGPYWTDRAKGAVKTQERKIGNTKVNCVFLQNRDSGSWNFCFDPQLGTLASKGGMYFSSDETAEYSDFTTFREKLLPATIRITRGRDAVLTFRLEQIAALDKHEADLSNPPQGAEEWPTCPNAPEPPKLLHQKGAGTKSPQPDVSGDVFTYAVVGTDGVLHDVKVLGAASPSDAAFTLAVLAGWVERPQTCHGQPQKTETIIRTSYTVHR
ncbi:MAG: hypothetical protein ACRD33_09270 [Candidatus Acidiferrales bacterium]